MSLLLLLLAHACGQKQAADPRDVLGEHMNYGGVDGRTGLPTAQSSNPSEDGAEPAESEDCGHAAEHIVRMGVDTAIKEERDPEVRQKLMAERKATLQGQEAKATVRRLAQECLDRGTSRAEVRCVLRAKAETDLDKCSAL